MRLTISLILGLFFLSSSVYGQHKPLVLIAYYSQSGNTKSMAQAVEEGAKSVSGVQVLLLPIEKVSNQELLEAEAIVVGSPVYNANVAPEVQQFINSWPFEGRPLKNKLGAAFVTGGGLSIGEELVQLNLLHSMLIQGMLVLGGAETEAAFGASAITGEAPFQTGKVEEQFLVKGRGLGKRVAEMALKIKK
ncbi:MAG: flavodoxin family protein [Algoriphagus sp.]|nr:flavodoxin family protein [Algoriphagus sp.]